MSTTVESKEPLLHDSEREAGQCGNRDFDINDREKKLAFFYRHTYLYTICCIFVGGAIYFLLSSIISDITMRTPCRPDLAVGLDLHLQPGEKAVENGYFCGYTPEEAQTNGCQFDLILYSWVPAQCYDEELQAEYRTRDSQWFRESEAINEVPQDVAAQGIEEELWLNWDYHIWHCRYTFLQMTRVLLNSSMGIPGRLIDPKHSEHCLNTLTGKEWHPLEEVGTVVNLNYSTCYSKN